MKSKSIAGFVLGLIAGIIFLLASFYLILLFGVIEGIAESFNGTTSQVPSFLAWATALGAVMSIIGAALCFKKAKTGGVIMLIATGLLTVFPAYVIIQTETINSLLLYWFIPLGLLLIGAICALCAKKVPVKQAQPVVEDEYKVSQSYCMHCGTKLSGMFCSNCGKKKGN